MICIGYLINASLQYRCSFSLFKFDLYIIINYERMIFIGSKWVQSEHESFWTKK